MAALVANPIRAGDDAGNTAPYDGVTSVAGLLSQLEEQEPFLQEHALQQLWDFGLVDRFWVEVVGKVRDIEALSEEPTFPAQRLAAAVASKCYYHLEDYKSALRLALDAGEFFNVESKTEYVEKMIAECIDRYTAKRIAAADAAAAGDDGDDDDDDLDVGQMESIVNAMFDRCFHDGAFTQAAGVALEARRLDKVEESIREAPDSNAMLSYVLETALEQVASHEFRSDVLRVLVRLYQEEVGGTPDYLSLCRCLQFLGDAASVARLLEQLVRASEGEGGEVSLLTAYQVAFDLIDNDNQQFMLEVAKSLPSRPTPPAEVTEAEADKATDGNGGAGGKAEEEPDSKGAPAGAESLLEKWDVLHTIVAGHMTTDIFLDFLYHNQKTDQVLLRRMKDAIESRSSLLHNALVVAHAYMACGTTVDRFLRVNMDWLRKAANWARFTATAGQGVVHKGHVKEAMTLLEPYLPKEGQAMTSEYTEGGSLYALGLIHANRGGGNTEVLSFLRSELDRTTNETIQHGACLGLGLAAMATRDGAVYRKLRELMLAESAVAGEAAGLGLGMLLAGAGSGWRASDESDGAAAAAEIDEAAPSAAQEMLSYAHSTRHEKVARGVAMGIALIVYGQEERADALIEQMMRDLDSIVRYGAMYAIGMAYAGTSNNSAIRRLLHVAVSDVSDDVRRAAVTCIGFVMVGKAHKVPTLVTLLAKSYNPHVRYGAAMALGVACAGTGNEDAVRLLEPLLEDTEGYVRQGAFLGLSMVLQQVSEGRSKKVKELREKITSVLGGKHHPAMEKMGALLGAGVLDAGGRNVVIALRSRAGFVKMPAVLGMAMWLQHWYWYPLLHMLSLSMTPTALIAVNKDMKLPKGFQVKCDAPPAWFAYPDPLEEKKAEKKERVKTVELSTTAKAKAKARAKKKAEEKEGDDADMGDGKEAAASADGAAAGGDADMGESPDGSGSSESKDTADKEKTDAEESEKPKEKPVDPGPFTVSSPARITYLQQKYVSFDARGRWLPVRTDASRNLGIVMVRDTRPGDEAELVDILSPPANLDDEGDEPDPPEPFEWTP